MRVLDVSRQQFVERFGGIFEHSSWIAESVFDAGLASDCGTAAGLHRAMVDIVRQAAPERQLALIEAHPDLAGRLAEQGKLTAGSTAEQASAGLDALSAAERAEFRDLNARYRERFGFPFIMAVKGRGSGEILAAFRSRLAQPRAAEIQTALTEIEKIALLRLREILP
jgi:OHCU decarboxylase